MWKSILKSVLQSKAEWAKNYNDQGIDVTKIESLAQFNQLPVLKKSELPFGKGRTFPLLGLFRRMRWLESLSPQVQSMILKG